MEVRIGFTCGAFDLLHPGHLHLLDWAKQHCDYLIVGLHTDPTIDRPTEKDRPVQSVFERWAQLNAVHSVDEIIPYETERDLRNLLATQPRARGICTSRPTLRLLYRHQPTARW